MLINANALAIPLADNSVHCVVTSPPYWNLRDYETAGQLGGENLHDCLGWATGKPCGLCFICQIVAAFREVRRVLRPDGTAWVNIGDCYASKPKWNNTDNGSSRIQGSRTTQRQTPLRKSKISGGLKEKDLCMMPARFALALQADGWHLRSEVIWHKTNPMPCPHDRPTPAHEPLYLLAKSNKNFYDKDAIREPSTGQTGSAANFKRTSKEAKVPGQAHAQHGAERAPTDDDGTRNKRSVWSIPTFGYPGAHYATYPPDLVKPCILAGTSARGVCPECGAPWKRIVEVIGKRDRSWHDHQNDDVLGQRGQPMPDGYERRTLGWKPGCKCGHTDTVPATVFDPFTGSGTTGEVALCLGRRFVGTDLSMKYLTENAAPRLAAVPMAMELVL